MRRLVDPSRGRAEFGTGKWCSARGTGVWGSGILGVVLVRMGLLGCCEKWWA